MIYRIKRHIRFRLKRPRVIRNENNSEASDKIKKSSKKAYERMDGEPRLKVNVLIMAKNKNNAENNGRTSASDLLKKLGREQDTIENEEFVDEIEYTPQDSFDSIDVSDENGFADSDSELDINELLRKYMPDYESEPEEVKPHGSVLSTLKESAAPADDEFEERLIDALDSAFGESVDLGADYGSDYAEYAESDPISEYDIDEEYAEEIDDEPAPAKKKGLFSFFTRRKREEPEYEAEEYDESAEVDDEYYADDPEYFEPDEEYRSDEETNTADEYEALNDEFSDENTSEESPVDDAGEVPNGYTEAPADEDFDPTDINLMIAFELDNEEGKHADRAKALGDRLEEKQIKRDSRANKIDHPEFVDKSQIPTLRKEFVLKGRALWIKLALALVFTSILLVFENITSITRLFTGNEQQFAGVFDPAVYPVVYIMTSLQLMLLACVCAYDQILDGFKYIFRGIPRPESMTSVLTVAGIVYSAVMAIIVKTPTEPVMFNFVVALSALLTLVYAVINNKREMMNFRIVASKKPKHIMRRLLDEESEGEARAFADAEDICDVMKIEKTDFIDGFYGRLAKSNQSTNTFMTFLMSISVAVAVLFGIFVNLRGGDGVAVFRVIYSAMLIIAPLSIFITFSYPFYRANLVAKEYDSAIIGEESLDEYSNASIISFDDKNVFPSYSVKVQNIRIYNNARIDRVLYYAASVFAYAGGPLQDVFEVATKDMGCSDNVQIFDTEAGFLATQVDGVNIIFGSRDALVRRGLEIPDNAAEDDVDLSGELEIMYMFRESKLVAKMYIKYVMDADIDLILKQFSGSGLYVCVRTFDPNIDERMIAKKLNMKRMPLKIVRYASPDEVGVYEEKVDSGLVTCGSPKSLLQIVSYCGKVLHTKKTNIALSVLSVMIGVAILLLLTLANSLDSLSSLFIAVYQLIWLIPMYISSKVFIR